MEEGEGEGEESPSKSKPFEKAVSEDEYGKWFGGSELRMRKSSWKEADEKSDIPIRGDWLGSSGGLLNEEQMETLLYQSLE